MTVEIVVVVLVLPCNFVYETLLFLCTAIPLLNVKRLHF